MQESLKYIRKYMKNSKIHTIEEKGLKYDEENRKAGELMGGYGQNIASFYGTSDMLVKNYGISKKFHTDFKAEKLLAENGMSVENITNEIRRVLEK